jgi:transposase-like protein/DDE family transposase
MLTTSQTPELPPISDEFSLAELGNRARTRRLCQLAETVARAPERSFPKLAGSDAELMALYRFLGNRSYDYLDIMEPHILQTVERIVEAQTALLIHDTTDFTFSGEVPRAGLGHLHGAQPGFLAHIGLALGAGGLARPLGVMALRAWARTGPKTSKRGGKKRSGSDYAKETDKESARWLAGVQEARARVGGRAQLIHIMDREGDIFTLLAWLVEQQERFVIRLRVDRAVGAEMVFGTQDHVSDVLCGVEAVAERMVPLSRRADSTVPLVQKTHPARAERTARLSFRATRMMLMRPNYLGRTYPKWLVVHVVHVLEQEPPAGEEPVEWTLLTTEPIDTAEQVLQIVDWYRARWTIEEFNKALKTGCAIEKRQLESMDALTKALALFVPIAWRLLLMRFLCRTCPQAPATEVLTPIQVDVLRHFSVRVPLDERPTVRQALLAVAGLGGHLKRNGEPGWLTLGRGYEELLRLELGWTAALDAVARAAKLVKS